MIENGHARAALNCSAAELGESLQIRRVQALIVNARFLAGRIARAGQFRDQEALQLTRRIGSREPNPVVFVRALGGSSEGFCGSEIRSAPHCYGLLPIGVLPTRIRSKMALGPDEVGPT